MAYNKNRRVFRSNRALERQKQIELNERSFRRVELDGMANKDMDEFIYQQTQKKNLKYINEISKYIEDNNIPYKDIAKLDPYSVIKSSSSTKASIDIKEWDNTINTLAKKYNNIQQPYLDEKAIIKLNYELKTIFDENESMVSDNIVRIKFNQPKEIKSKYAPDLTKGVAIIERFGEDFVNIMSPNASKQNADQLVKTAIENVNKTMILTGNSVGKTNQSIHSIEEARKNLQRTGNLVVFDLETFGGKDLETRSNMFDRVTEISFRNIQNGVEVSNDTALLGVDRKTMNDYVDKIYTAMKDGTFRKDSDLGVIASRLAKYGESEIEKGANGIAGLVKVTKFPGDDFDINKETDIEAIKKGANVLVDAFEYSNAHKVNGIDVGTRMMIDNAKNIQDIFLSGNGVVAGYNHLAYDIPFLNSRLQKLYNSGDQAIVNYMDQKFKGNISLDPTSLGGPGAINKTLLDMRSVVETATNTFGISAMYGNDQAMISEVANTPNRQEYIAATYQKGRFARDGGEAHKADFDTQVLKELLIGEIDNAELRQAMNIPDNYHGSALDYMMDHMTKDGFDAKGGILRRAKRYDFNPQDRKNMYFMLKGKDRSRGSIYRGQGHLDFSYNTQTKDFHFANMAATVEGKVEENEYYKSMNKDAIYKISGIKKFDPSDEFIKEMGDLYPEYASGQLYALEFKQVVGKNAKGTVADTQRHVKIFKTFDEMEGFLSSQMDLVGAIENGQFNFKNNYEAKLGTTNMGSTTGKSDSDILKEYVDEIDDKLAKDSSRRYFLDKDKSYKRIKKLINFADEIENDATLKSMSIFEMNNRFSQAVVNAKNGAPIEKVSQNLARVLRDNIGYADFNDGYKQKLYRSTGHNAINALEFIKENRTLLDSVLAEVDAVTRTSDGKNFLAGHNDNTASYILKNVLNEIALDNAGSGQQNTLTKKQMKSTFDVEIKGIYNHKNTRHVADRAYIQEDIISLSNIYDQGVEYTFLNKMMSAGFSNNTLKSMSEEEELNAQRHMIEKFMKDADFDKSDLDDVNNMLKNDTFNPLEASRRIISSMRKQKAKNGEGYGIINLKSNDGFENINPNVIDQVKLQNKLKNDPDYIKNLVQKNKNIKHIDLKDIKTTANSYVNTLIDFNKTDIEKSVLSNYGSIAKGSLGGKELATKNILFENARTELSNMMGDLFASAQQAGADIEFNQNTNNYAIRQGNKLVDIVMPKLKMTNNGMMYIQYGSQNIKLRHKVLVDNKGTVSIGTSINNVYRENKAKGQTIYKNANRVRQAIEDGTFEIGQIADYFKRDLKDLAEDAKMVTIKGGDYYSNMTLDAKEFLSKGIYAIFGTNPENGKEYENLQHFGEFIRNSELYDKKFAKNFERQFGKMLNDENLSPEALLYMARESPLILDKLFRYMGKATGDSQFEVLADNLNIGSKKQETENGIYALGEQRENVIISDLWNNHARPVSGGSGNFKYLKVNQATTDIKNLDSINIKKGALISNQHYDSINTIMENGEEYISSVRMKTLYTGDIGLDAIIKLQFDEVLKKNTVKNNQAEMDKYTQMFADIKGNASVFEQQKIMDPLAFEKAYGSNVAADTKYFSKGLDLIGAILEDDEATPEALKMRERLIGSLPTVTNDNGTIKFTSGVGQVVSRNDKVFEHKGFGGINEMINSKLRAGVLEFTVQNREGIELTDAQISKVLNKYANEFNKASIPEQTSVALNILEREGYVAKFGVKDINKITLPKMNSGSGEKSMTSLLYAKTGTVDKDIRDVFNAIQRDVFDNKVGLVGNTVLRRDAALALLNRYEDEVGNLDNLLANFAGSSISKKKEDLLQRLAKEQMTYRDIIFGQGKLKGISAISNDAIAKHKNVGMMMENNLANAIDILGKYMDPDAKGTTASYNKALDFVINTINSDSSYALFKNEQISGLSGGDLSAKMIDLKVSKGKHNNLNVEGLRFTDEEHTIIDGSAFKNLIKRIDQEISDQAAKNNKTRAEEDRLVIDKFHKINTKTGQVELVKKEHYGQALFIKGKNGEDIMAGTIVTDIESFIDDPETQTDVDYRYIYGKRQIIQREKQQRELEKQLRNYKNKLANETDNTKIAELNKKIKTTKDALNLNSDALSQLRDEVSAYKVKPMRYTSTDERLLKSHNFNEALVNRLNTANKEFGEDMIEKHGSSALKEILDRDADGKYVLNMDKTDMRKSVFDQFIDRMRGLNTRKEGERLLTEADVTTGKYTKYKEIYDRVVGINKQELGVDTVKDLWDLDRANKAFHFNVLGTGHKKSPYTLEQMKQFGFEISDIDHFLRNEFKTDSNAIDTTLDKHMVVDLGTMFDEENRYIALPGLGKFVGDDDEAQRVRREYQNKMGSLKHKFETLNRFANTQDAQLEVNGRMMTRDDAKQDVLDAIKDVKIALDENLYGKKGAITLSGVSEMPMVTARQKITGVGYLFNQKDSFFKNAENVDILEDALNTKSAMAKAQINGKSLLEWDRMGVHYDYAFASEDVFRSMGFFDEKVLQDLGETEASMIKRLETEGIDTLAVRYPEIYDSSMINTKMFLDRTTTGNATKVAEHTMRKFNGDVDGDSMSFLMLETKGGMNSLSYKKLRDYEIANGTERLKKKIEQDQKYSYEDDYLLFKQAQVKAEADALTLNRDWREDARKIRAKDYNKNIESTIDAISGDVHRAKITNLVDDKKLKHIDNSIDNMLNDAMSIIKNLETNNPDVLSSSDFKDNYSNISKLLEEVMEDNNGKIADGYKVTVKEMKNPTKLMDESLKLIKQYGDLDKESEYSKGWTLRQLISDTGNYTISSNVRKMYNEQFIEQNNKTGAAAIGSVNVKLVPLKNASRNVFTPTGKASAIAKDTAVQEIAAKIEQNAINFKKQEATGNQDAVTRINEALNTYMNKNKNEGKKMLEDWFDSVSGDDAFADIYGTMTKGLSEKDQARLNDIVVSRSLANGTSKDVERSRIVRNTFMSAVSNLRESEMGQSYFNNPIGRGGIDRSAITGTVVMEKGSDSDILNNVIGVNVYGQLEEARAAQKAKITNAENARDFMDNISSSSLERPVNSLMNESRGILGKLMGHRSSGLAMGVIGLASGLLISGFASGNPLQQDESPYLSDNNHTQPQSIPEFFDQQGGYAQQSNNGGYIINVRADTKKGKKELERTMKKVAKQGFGNVSVNMSVRDKNKPRSNQDIQNWIASNL